jgi:hypothetical protein
LTPTGALDAAEAYLRRNERISAITRLFVPIGYAGLTRKEPKGDPLKRALSVIAVMVAVAVSAAGAGAAPPQAKQIKTLQAQVKTLQKQVKTLQAQMRVANAEISYSFAATTCTLAMTADIFQATWTALDNAGITGAPFSALVAPPVNDYNACSDLHLTRATGLSLPAWAAYNSLISWIWGPAS